jgi:hypothetical protein
MISLRFFRLIGTRHQMAGQLSSVIGQRSQTAKKALSPCFYIKELLIPAYLQMAQGEAVISRTSRPRPGLKTLYGWTQFFSQDLHAQEPGFL